MKVTKSSGLVGVGCSAAALALALMSNVAGSQTVKPNVTVVNTAANPVPVTGTVTSNVSGTVNASQSGTWNVGITGTPTVAISGSVTTHPEEQPADTAVQFELAADCDSESYTVPDGNRLVIQFVSAYTIGNAGSDAAVVVRMRTSLNGSAQFHHLSLQRTNVVYANAVPMIAYADENTNVCYDIAFLNGGPINPPRVGITGHLVAQP